MSDSESSASCMTAILYVLEPYAKYELKQEKAEDVGASAKIILGGISLIKQYLISIGSRLMTSKLTTHVLDTANSCLGKGMAIAI